MKTKLVSQKDHFLNEQQKKAKQKIMEDLMKAFFENIKDNWICFENDSVALMDLITSILIMFNREILVHTFVTFEIIGQQKDFMKGLFAIVKEQVNIKLKEKIM